VYGAGKRRFLPAALALLSDLDVVAVETWGGEGIGPAPPIRRMGLLESGCTCSRDSDNVRAAPLHGIADRAGGRERSLAKQRVRAEDGQGRAALRGARYGCLPGGGQGSASRPAARGTPTVRSYPSGLPPPVSCGARTAAAGRGATWTAPVWQYRQQREVDDGLVRLPSGCSGSRAFPHRCPAAPRAWPPEQIVDGRLLIEGSNPSARATSIQAGCCGRRPWRGPIRSPVLRRDVSGRPIDRHETISSIFPAPMPARPTSSRPPIGLSCFKAAAVTPRHRDRRDEEGLLPACRKRVGRPMGLYRRLARQADRGRDFVPFSIAFPQTAVTAERRQP